MSKSRFTSPPASSSAKLTVSVRSTAPLRVRYFDTINIELEIANLTAETLFIEAVTLKFDADTGATPIYVDCCPGLRLPGNDNSVVAVTVRPTPLYREYTDQFVVRLKCYSESGGRIGTRFTEEHSGFYIIIERPSAKLGEVFISFKQPEDQGLANILERYALRAGFTPHLFMRNPHLGSDQWKNIEQLIKGAHSAFIVWALRTDWGEGVEREIKLCRKYKIREVLLIEEGVELPELYRGTNRAYKRFDPSNPAKAFSEAISSVHEQVNAPR